MKPELSPRELQVTMLVLKDRLSKQIAGDLNLSIKTVEKHRYSIYKKLNCHNFLQLLKKCLQLNIITMEEFLKD
jgi:DNA-binding CsgD family transcriptional regulator